jgi:hypothetical protein
MLYSNSQIKDREKSNDIFNINQSNSSYPARIADYKKISPTKFVVDVKNATRPYVMTFAESYDPLWVAYDTSTSINSIANNNNNNFKTNSFPLYSIVNGFYVNKRGDYTLTIEYEPQKWFEQAGMISIAALISVPLVILWMHQKRKNVRK